MPQKQEIRRLDEIIEEIDKLPETYLSPLEFHDLQRKNLFTTLRTMSEATDKVLELIQNKAKKQTN